MTIDEYLNQGKCLRRNVDKLSEHLEVLESRVLYSGSSLNGMPTGNRSDNAHESRLMEYLDASKDYHAAYDEYTIYRERMKEATYNILHWQALVINRVYYMNVFTKCPNELYGVDAILNTTDRSKIMAKLHEAKTALADRLREQGVELE